MQKCVVVTILAAIATASTAHSDDKEDRKKIEGAWTVLKVVQAGVEFPLSPEIKNSFTFTADEAIHEDGGGKKASRYKLDSTQKPAQIDLLAKDGSDKGKTYKGIYELNGDSLRLCFAPPGEERPTAFASKKEEKFMAFELKRDKK